MIQKVAAGQQAEYKSGDITRDVLVLEVNQSYAWVMLTGTVQGEVLCKREYVPLSTLTAHTYRDRVDIAPYHESLEYNIAQLLVLVDILVNKIDNLEKKFYNVETMLENIDSHFEKKSRW